MSIIEKLGITPSPWRACFDKDGRSFGFEDDRNCGVPHSTGWGADSYTRKDATQNLDVAFVCCACHLHPVHRW